MVWWIICLIIVCCQLLWTSKTLHLGDKGVFWTMAATYRQIQEFCSEIESIEAYIKRVELYFEAPTYEWQYSSWGWSVEELYIPPAQLVVSREARCQDAQRRIDSRSQETFRAQKGGYRRTFQVLSAWASNRRERCRLWSRTATTFYALRLWRVLGPSTVRQTGIGIKEVSDVETLALKMGYC